MKSDLEEMLLGQIREAGLPEPERQYRAVPGRRWAFDFAWLGDQPCVLLEVMGGLFNRGGHVRGVQYEKDCEKANAAVQQGYAVYRVTGKQVEDGRAIALLKAVLEGDD